MKWLGWVALIGAGGYLLYETAQKALSQISVGLSSVTFGNPSGGANLLAPIVNLSLTNNSNLPLGITGATLSLFFESAAGSIDHLASATTGAVMVPPNSTIQVPAAVTLDLTYEADLITQLVNAVAGASMDISLTGSVQVGPVSIPVTVNQSFTIQSLLQ
jgi:hypothetical protein